MRMCVLRSCVVAVVVLLAAPCGALPVNTIPPGTNFMKTQPGSVWDFSTEPIEEQRFGPGSDPFDGLVYVVTVTKVGRGESTEFINDKAGVPVEIVAMTLHSVEPVPIVFDRGLPEERTVLYDVVVTPHSTGPNAGMYKVARDPSGGSPDRGMILANGPGDPDPEPIPPDSFFDVFFDFEFIPQDGSESIHVQRGDHLTLTADVPWDSMAPPLYYSPLAGDFYPGFARPPDPHMLLQDPNVPEALVFQGQHFTWHLRLEPIAEPTTLGLLAVGGVALLRRRQRAR